MVMLDLTIEKPRSPWRDSLKWIWPMIDGSVVEGWNKKSTTLKTVEDMEISITVETSYILYATEDGPVWTTRKAVYETSAPHLAEIPKPLAKTDRFNGMKYKAACNWLLEHGYTKAWPKEKV